MATEQALAIPAAAMPILADIGRNVLSHLRLFSWAFHIWRFNLATMSEVRHVFTLGAEICIVKSFLNLAI